MCKRVAVSPKQIISLSASDRKVWAYIWQWKKENPTSPPLDRIADDLRMPRSTVYQCLGRLKRKGFIVSSYYQKGTITLLK